MPLLRLQQLIRKLLRPNTTAEFSVLERDIGHVFRDIALLRTALTHPSVKCRRANGTAPEPDYQRLEFLGDAVLGLVFAETLYEDAEADEGVLTNARSRVACGSNLAAIGRRLELGKLMRLAAGGNSAHIRQSDAAHEDMLEALFGAVYLDAGIEAARKVAVRLFGDTMRVGAGTGEVEGSRSAKSKLQELVQRDGRPNDGRRIEYRTVAENGPVRSRIFTIEVWVDGVRRGSGNGRTKQRASENAAAEALNFFSTP